jgi:Fe-S-cluster containining protein
MEPATKPCSRCGKCCTNPSFQGNLMATGEDVLRWQREGRQDILRFAAVLPGPPDNPVADLWVDTEKRDKERERCPFVRKDRGQHTYRCTIYDTRPQVCRDYVPFSGLWNDICEEVK